MNIKQKKVYLAYATEIGELAAMYFDKTNQKAENTLLDVKLLTKGMGSTSKRECVNANILCFDMGSTLIFRDFNQKVNLYTISPYDEIKQGDVNGEILTDLHYAICNSNNTIAFSDYVRRDLQFRHSQTISIEKQIQALKNKVDINCGDMLDLVILISSRRDMSRLRSLLPKISDLKFIVLELGVDSSLKLSSLAIWFWKALNCSAVIALNASKYNVFCPPLRPCDFVINQSPVFFVGKPSSTCLVDSNYIFRSEDECSEIDFISALDACIEKVMFLLKDKQQLIKIACHQARSITVHN